MTTAARSPAATAALALLAFILLAKLVLGVIVAVQVPLWTAYHHEIDSYNVARIIVAEGRLPIPPDYPAGQFEVRQGSQPPAYGLLTAPVVAAFGAEGRVSTTPNPAPFCINGEELIVGFETDRAYNPPYSGHARGGMALRLLNLSLGLAAVTLTFVAGRVAFPQTPLVAVVAAGILAFEPYTLRLNSVILNDNLLLLVAAAHLLTAVTLIQADRLHIWPTMALFVLGAASVLTKLNGWVTLAVSLVLVAFLLVRNNRHRRLSRDAPWFIAGGGMLILLGILAILAFNQAQYGTVLGRYESLPDDIAALWNSRGRIVSTILPTLQHTAETYSGALRDIGLPLRVLQAYQFTGATLLLLPLWGALHALIYRDWHAFQLYLLGALLTLGAAALVMLRSAQTQLVTDIESIIFAPLRYYFVGAPAAALMIAAGFAALRWTHPLGLITVTVYLGFSIATAQANTPGKILRESLHPLPTSTTTATSPALLNMGLAADGGTLLTTLDMAAPQPLSTNLRGQIVLTGANGETFTCQFVPLRGIYPTPRWEPDQMIRQTLAVENCANAMSPPVEVAFSWVDEDNTVIPATSATLDTPLPTSPFCPPNLGIIADELQLTAIRTPDTAHRGSGYEPQVNWLVLQQPLRAQRRTFTLQHTPSDTTYTCTGFADIHNATDSTQQFGDLRRVIPPGFTIHADGCVLQIPEDAPTGVYTIYVSLTDANGNPLPVAPPDAANRLQLDTVTLR
jgi:hypothetical protein